MHMKKERRSKETKKKQIKGNKKESRRTEEGKKTERRSKEKGKKKERKSKADGKKKERRSKKDGKKKQKKSKEELTMMSIVAELCSWKFSLRYPLPSPPSYRPVSSGGSGARTPTNNSPRLYLD